MGLENMRRWPVFIVIAGCIMLMLSLLNSWGLETELRNQLEDVTLQLKTCYKQQSTCQEESLNLRQENEGFVSKLGLLGSEKTKLHDEIKKLTNKTNYLESQSKHNLMDAKNCQTTLESTENLRVTMVATLEALRLKNKKLTEDLHDKDQKLIELEAEINKLKMNITTIGAINASKSVTPVGQPVKLSSSLNARNPINEPVIENAAKEEFEDDFDGDTHVH